MQTFLGLFMIIANFVAGVIVFFSLNRYWDNRKKLIALAVVYGGMYLIVSILYLLSSIGLNASQLPSGAKNLLISAFVAVNIILFIPFIIRSYNKVEIKELGQKKFENRLKLAGVIFVIVLFMEFFSIRGTIKNIFEQYNALVDKEKADHSNVVSNEIDRSTTENRSVTTEQQMNTTTDTTSDSTTNITRERRENVLRNDDYVPSSEPVYTEIMR